MWVEVFPDQEEKQDSEDGGEQDTCVVGYGLVECCDNGRVGNVCMGSHQITPA